MTVDSDTADSIGIQILKKICIPRKSESTVPEGFVVGEFDDSLLVYLMQMLNDVPRIGIQILKKIDQLLGLWGTPLILSSNQRVRGIVC